MGLRFCIIGRDRSGVMCPSQRIVSGTLGVDNDDVHLDHTAKMAKARILHGKVTLFSLYNYQIFGGRGDSWRRNILLLLKFSPTYFKSCLWQFLLWCSNGKFLFLHPSIFINWNFPVRENSPLFTYLFIQSFISGWTRISAVIIII